MPPRFRAAAIALAASLLAPSFALADCSTASSGARCIGVPSRPTLALAAVSATPAPASLVGVGDVLERGRYSILLNADYYGLPPVSDGWVYMKVGADLYRVDWRSQEVLERVTHEAAANF